MRFKPASAPWRTRVAVSLAVTLALILGWAVPAMQAQSAFEGQYGSPTASPEAVLEEASGPAGSGYSPAGGSGGGADLQSGSWGSSVGGVLPETGGPILQLLALGIAVLSGALLLALRRRGGA